TDADPIRSVRAWSMPARIHLARPHRDLEDVLPGRDGAVVMRREGAGRVVRPVEVEHVAVGVAGDRLRLEVAPYRVGVVAGGGVAEEDGDRRLADARLEQPQRGEM